MPKRTHQVAALPWRQGKNGIEILLVTTRTTKRWVLPKGWTMEGKADHEAAAIEAYEEAGVEGVAEAKSLGEYSYIKILSSRKQRRLTVKIYALRVQRILEDWPEKTERDRQWVDKSRAVATIGEAELVPIVAALVAKQLGERTVLYSPRSIFATLLYWWRTKIKSS